MKVPGSVFVGSLSVGALGDLAGIVPLLVVSAIMYCASGVLALLLLRRPQARGEEKRASQN